MNKDKAKRRDTSKRRWVILVVSFAVIAMFVGAWALRGDIPPLPEHDRTAQVPGEPESDSDAPDERSVRGSSGSIDASTRSEPRFDAGGATDLPTVDVSLDKR